MKIIEKNLDAVALNPEEKKELEKQFPFLVLKQDHPRGYYSIAPIKPIVALHYSKVLANLVLYIYKELKLTVTAIEENNKTFFIIREK